MKIDRGIEMDLMRIGNVLPETRPLHPVAILPDKRRPKLPRSNDGKLSPCHKYNLENAFCRNSIVRPELKPSKDEINLNKSIN